MQPGHKLEVLDLGHVIYIDHMGTDRDVARAARVSYHKAEDETKTEVDDRRLIYRLYRDRHTSPFEMCKIVFTLKMPIFIARQYVRHRMQNMNEVSARYTELPDDFYVPEKWRAQDPKNKQSSILGPDKFELPYMHRVMDVDGSGFDTNDPTLVLEQHYRACYSLYKEMLQAGIAREMARMVLPFGTYTEMRCCWDLKNLLHFFSLRDDPHAQWEHRQFGKAMKIITRVLFPMVMDAYDKYKFECMDTMHTA